MKHPLALCTVSHTNSRTHTDRRPPCRHHITPHRNSYQTTPNHQPNDLPFREHAGQSSSPPLQQSRFLQAWHIGSADRLGYPRAPTLPPHTLRPTRDCRASSTVFKSLIQNSFASPARFARTTATGHSLHTFDTACTPCLRTACPLDQQSICSDHFNAAHGGHAQSLIGDSP